MPAPFDFRGSDDAPVRGRPRRATAPRGGLVYTLVAAGVGIVVILAAIYAVTVAVNQPQAGREDRVVPWAKGLTWEMIRAYEENPIAAREKYARTVWRCHASLSRIDPPDRDGLVPVELYFVPEYDPRQNDHQGYFRAEARLPYSFVAAADRRRFYLWEFRVPRVDYYATGLLMHRDIIVADVRLVD